MDKGRKDTTRGQKKENLRRKVRRRIECQTVSRSWIHPCSNQHRQSTGEAMCTRAGSGRWAVQIFRQYHRIVLAGCKSIWETGRSRRSQPFAACAFSPPTPQLNDWRLIINLRCYAKGGRQKVGGRKNLIYKVESSTLPSHRFKTTWSEVTSNSTLPVSVT